MYVAIVYNVNPLKMDITNITWRSLYRSPQSYAKKQNTHVVNLGQFSLAYNPLQWIV